MNWLAVEEIETSAATRGVMWSGSRILHGARQVPTSSKALAEVLLLYRGLIMSILFFDMGRIVKVIPTDVRMLR